MTRRNLPKEGEDLPTGRRIELVEVDGFYMCTHMGDGTRGKLSFNVASSPKGLHVFVKREDGTSKRYVLPLRDVIEAALDDAEDT